MQRRYYLFAFLFILTFVPAISMKLENHGSSKNKVENDISPQNGTSKRDPIWWAASKGNLTRVQTLLAQDPTIADTFDTKHDNQTALHWATGNGHTEIVKCLLDAGANPNNLAADGKTPLHRVAKISVVRLLLGAEAKPDIQDSFGKTPLHWIDDSEIAALLIEHDANIHLKDSQGKTPLYWAANSGNLRIIKLLLESGADINNCDARGFTPLHAAVMNGMSATVRFLVEQKGININVKDLKKERTPLCLAFRFCKGACKKNHTQNSIGTTISMIINLINKGANPKILDRKGKSCDFWIDNMQCSDLEKQYLRKALHYRSLKNEERQELFTFIKSNKKDH